MSDLVLGLLIWVVIVINVILWRPDILRWMDRHHIPSPRILERCWYAIRDTIKNAGCAVAKRVKRVRH